MGTAEFAVPSLEALLENNLPIVAVVTAPDKPRGRGLELLPSPVKVCALNHRLPVLQPANLKSPEFLDTLRKYRAELQVVVAFRMLPEAVWSMPPRGTINLHASLLPQYRGAAPINWAIIQGEKETGVTTFFLKHEIDTGNIILQEKEPILENDDAGSLYERLMKKGSQLVVRTVDAIRSGQIPSLPQPESADLRHAPKIFKENCEVSWNQSVSRVRNFVRGLSPYPAAWTLLNAKTFKLFRTSPSSFQKDGTPGEFTTDNKTYLYIRASDGWISVDELQPEGKRRMTVAEFFRGNKL
jgi:methionyl-tRNA formyltransferase